MAPVSTAPSLGAADSAAREETIGAPEKHGDVVPPLSAPVHEHIWVLRDTEYDDIDFTVNRFECDCGEVSYT